MSIGFKRDPVGQEAAAKLEEFRDGITSQYEHFAPWLEEAGRQIRDEVRARLENLTDNPNFQLQSFGPKAYHRVKSLESTRTRCEERVWLSLAEVPDLIGCRVVFLDRNHHEDVRAALGELVEGGKWVETRYSDGGGRGSGYGGTFATGLTIAEHTSAEPPELWKSAACQVDARDLKWELQIQSTMQEAWASLSHEGFYKAQLGVPSESAIRLRRLASVLDLIDLEISHVNQVSAADRIAIRQRLASRPTPSVTDSLPLDEFVLKTLEVGIPTKLKKLRAVGRAAGLPISGWPELVRIGDETELCLEICAKTGIRTFGELRGAMDRLLTTEETTIAQLKNVGPMPDDEPLYDRPLVVFSTLQYLNSPEVTEINAIKPFLGERLGSMRRAALETREGHAG